jgi:hypothetical protein
MVALNETPKIMRKTIKTRDVKRKSTIFASMVAIGKTSLGRYILVMRAVFEIMLCVS